MKMRPVLQLVVPATVAWCLASAVCAQPGWPGIMLGRGTTGAGGERITYGNGGFLVTSFYLFAPPGGTTATSPDGFHWTVHTVTNSIIVGSTYGVSAGNANFVAIGNSATYYGDPAGTNGLVQFSPDGVVWGQPVTIPSAPLSGVTYANGTYVAVGQSGGAAAIVTSSDGVLWNTRTFAGYGPLRAVTTGGGTFVAVGDSGAILTSTNGSDWLTQVVLPGASISTVAYGNGMFVAGVYGNFQVLTSTNGTNWMISESSPPWGRVAYGNGLFVGISNDIDVSTNGVDWTLIWTHPGADIVPQEVAYGAGTFSVLLDYGNLINVSPRAFLGWSVETNGVLDLTLTGGWLGQSCRKGVGS